MAKQLTSTHSACPQLSIKALGSGQMCTNTDYVLVPKHMVDKLMTAFRGALDEFYPPGTSFEPGKTAHLSQMVHTGAYDRITRLIDSAKESGCEVVGNQRDPERRRIGLTLVEFTSKDEASPLVNEELFGPILPIVAVEVSKGASSRSRENLTGHSNRMSTQRLPTLMPNPTPWPSMYTPRSVRRLNMVRDSASLASGIC